MSVKALLRRTLHVLVAANMALALLHGPSMAFADAALNSRHLSPHHGVVHEPVAHAQHEEPASADHRDHNAGAMPGCPLAAFAAVQAIPAELGMLGKGEAINERPLSPLASSNPSLADPPPRSAA
jgi:hypothetical protein